MPMPWLSIAQNELNKKEKYNENNEIIHHAR